MSLLFRPPSVCLLCAAEPDVDPECPYCSLLRESGTLSPSEESVEDLRSYRRARREERRARADASLRHRAGSGASVAVRRVQGREPPPGPRSAGAGPGRPARRPWAAGAPPGEREVVWIG